MDKRLNILVMAAFLSGQAQAFPVEAIASFFGKLFKGGAVAKEAAAAGRGAEGAAGAKGLEHLAASDTAKVGPALQAFESKPDMASDVMAMSRRDAEAYKAFRASAEKGDATAMLRMSEMTASGKIIDLGEPWRGYWLFQSARLGSQAAVQKSRDECSAKEGRRATDKWFDLACASSDGRSLFIGDKLPGASYTPFGTGSLVKPAGLPGAKP